MPLPRLVISRQISSPEQAPFPQPARLFYLRRGTGGHRKLQGDDKIRLATIGMGGQGFSNTRTALEVPGVELVAATDCYGVRLTRTREVFGKGVMTTRM